MAYLQIFCVHYYRKGRCKALVSRSAIDDYRFFGAVHPGVATGCSIGLGPVVDAFTVALDYGGADICTPISPESLFSNFCVVFYLPLNHFPHFLYVDAFSKLHYVVDSKEGPVCRVGVAFLFVRL